MILVLHAYSRGNRGDGLLVDLTLELIHEALPNDQDIHIVAVDALSFADLKSVIQAPMVSGSFLGKIIITVMALAKIGLHFTGIKKIDYSELSSPVKNADLIIGVGGGYLRSGNLSEGLKSLVIHGIQLLSIEEADCTKIYLSQSVGPLKGIFGQLLKKTFGNVDIFCLRDDRSVSELSWHCGASRYPDLAILKIANEQIERNKSYENIYLIARDINRPEEIKKKYIQSLQVLREKLPNLEVVLQSDVRGNNDGKLYKIIGWGNEFRALRKAIAESGKGVVISVRLHGALESIIMGCPAVHLSYERKGYGAYEDLNLMSYVHNVTTFDTDLVVNQVNQLCNDSNTYWESISIASESIDKKRTSLINIIKQRYHLRAE
jgi:polysaccharide pyruvyl transferase WcaK-like protein